jgi:hypothetical protein
VKKCVHMHVVSIMIPVETVPWTDGGGLKGRGGGGEFKYDMVDTL